TLGFFFSSRRRHTRFSRDWSSDVCSSDLGHPQSSTGYRHPQSSLHCTLYYSVDSTPHWSLDTWIFLPRYRPLVLDPVLTSLARSYLDTSLAWGHTSSARLHAMVAPPPDLTVYVLRKTDELYHF